MRKSSLDALTGARFFAALYVLAFHCFISGQEVTGAAVRFLPWPLVNFLDRGNVAVDFFFLLSGFILAYNYSTKGGRMACTKHDFWVARFARIWPMYMIGLLIGLPLYLEGLVGLHTHPVSALLHTLPHLAGNALLLNAWLVQLNDINLPGWSLSAEAFFYLVFPFVLFPLAKLSNRRLFQTALVFYILSLLPTVIYAGWRSLSTHFYDFWGLDPRDWDATIHLYLLPPLRLPEFLIGVAMGIIYNRTPHAGRNAVVSNCSLAVLALVVGLSLVMVIPWPILRSSFYAPLCAWVIWGLAREHDGLIYRLLSSKTCILLGQASYGFYLFHYPISNYVYALFLRLGFEPSVWFMVLLFLVTFSIVTPLSIVLFYLVEEPSRKFLRRWLTTDRGFLRSLQRT